MSKQFVKDLKIGSQVQAQFVVADVKELSYSAPSKSGEYFVKLLLGDISGTIKGIIWDKSMVTEPIRPDDVLLVSGEVTDYYGPQLVVNYFQKLDKDKINRHHFQPSSSRDSREMWCSLLRITSQAVSNPYLNKLLQVIFDDQKILDRFMLAPAAKTIHHNYLGGLLEHTLEVAEICLKLIELYPEKLDGSLLVTGSVLHDLGKIEEYDLDSFTFQQTDRGRLLGHISIGAGMIREKVQEVSGFPDPLMLALEHMILSHHGEKEWGSPEVPQIFEAFALFHADLLSARMKQFFHVMDKNHQKDSTWTEWDRFLGRRVFTGFYSVTQD